MHELGVRTEYPQLKALVAEASRALARLDAERLEELALSCQALNRSLKPSGAARRLELAVEAREAAQDMAVLERVLEATRANLNVMRRLRDLRSGRIEFGDPLSGSGRGSGRASSGGSGRGWKQGWTESGYGDD